jgi:hypothetical protein
MPEQITRPPVVLDCQGCTYTWEPGRVDLDDLAELLGSGCPQCGDWLWFGELAVPAPRAGELG